MKNYYKILGTDQTATAHEIKQVHKTLLAKYSASDAHENGYTAERYIDIAIAYETLVHTEKRMEYDRILNSILPSLPQENSKQQKAPEVIPETIIIPKSKYNPVRYGLYIGVLLIVLTAITFIQIRKPKTPDAAYTAQATSANNSIEQSLKDIRQQDKKLSTPTPVQKNEPDAVVTTLTAPAARPDKIIKNKEIQVPTPQPKQLPVATPNHNQQIPDIVSEPEPASIAVAGDPRIGTSKKEVLRALGTPRAIVRYDNDNEIWRYSNKNIYFSSNKIISLNDVGSSHPGESHYE